LSYVVGLEIDLDSDDGSSLSSRTSILSKSRRLDHRPSTTQRKDVLTDVDDIAKMTVR